MPSTFTSTSEMSWGVNLREGQKLKTQNVARDNCHNGFLNVNAFVQKQQFREFKKDKGDPSKLSLKQGDYKFTHTLMIYLLLVLSGTSTVCFARTKTVLAASAREVPVANILE